MAFFFASFRKDYVSKCVDYVFNTSVKAVYEEFQRGFYKLFDKEILKHFKPEELMRAIIGNTDYDWEQFEKDGEGTGTPLQYSCLDNPMDGGAW